MMHRQHQALVMVPVEVGTHEQYDVVRAPTEVLVHVIWEIVPGERETFTSPATDHEVSIVAMRQVRGRLDPQELADAVRDWMDEDGRELLITLSEDIQAGVCTERELVQDEA